MPAPSSHVISSPAREVSCPPLHYHHHQHVPVWSTARARGCPGLVLVVVAGESCPMFPGEECSPAPGSSTCTPRGHHTPLQAASVLLLSTQNMVITTLAHNNATWTHTDTGHKPWQLLFKQFSSRQINVSQNMFARSQLGTFYRVYTLPGPNTGQVGAGFWVAAEPRWRCCKSSWISPFTLQQELCLTGDQRGTL